MNYRQGGLTRPSSKFICSVLVGYVVPTVLKIGCNFFLVSNLVKRLVVIFFLTRSATRLKYWLFFSLVKLVTLNQMGNESWAKEKIPFDDLCAES